MTLTPDALALQASLSTQIIAVIPAGRAGCADTYALQESMK